MQFLEDPKHKVTLLIKDEKSVTNRGTFTTGWRDWSGDLRNEIEVNGAQLVEKDTGFVNTEFDKETGTLTVVVRKRKTWKRILVGSGKSNCEVLMILQ